MLQLFTHLNGTEVMHGSPGYENKEVIESITTKGVEDSHHITVQFKSGCFTHIAKKMFDYFLEDGTINYTRAAGFTALERLEVIE